MALGELTPLLQTPKLVRMGSLAAPSPRIPLPLLTTFPPPVELSDSPTPDGRMSVTGLRNDDVSRLLSIVDKQTDQVRFVVRIKGRLHLSAVQCLVSARVCLNRTH